MKLAWCVGPSMTLPYRIRLKRKQAKLQLLALLTIFGMGPGSASLPQSLVLEWLQKSWPFQCCVMARTGLLSPQAR